MNSELLHECGRAHMIHVNYVNNAPNFLILFIYFYHDFTTFLTNVK